MSLALFFKIIPCKGFRISEEWLFICLQNLENAQWLRMQKGQKGVRTEVPPHMMLGQCELTDSRAPVPIKLCQCCFPNSNQTKVDVQNRHRHIPRVHRRRRKLLHIKLSPHRFRLEINASSLRIWSSNITKTWHTHSTFIVPKKMAGLTFHQPLPGFRSQDLSPLLGDACHKANPAHGSPGTLGPMMAHSDATPAAEDPPGTCRPHDYGAYWRSQGPAVSSISGNRPWPGGSVVYRGWEHL